MGRLVFVFSLLSITTLTASERLGSSARPWLGRVPSSQAWTCSVTSISTMFLASAVDTVTEAKAGSSVGVGAPNSVYSAQSSSMTWTSIVPGSRTALR